ncbi:hypothetical protein TYRP_016579 [Tyrophagus putrescentiae]|nr:hypothetical protein TYRP_016579 [Tyrophagus putrescentiae]
MVDNYYNHFSAYVQLFILKFLFYFKSLRRHSSIATEREETDRDRTTIFPRPSHRRRRQLNLCECFLVNGGNGGGDALSS